MKVLKVIKVIKVMKVLFVLLVGELIKMGLVDDGEEVQLHHPFADTGDNDEENLIIIFWENSNSLR